MSYTRLPQTTGVAYDSRQQRIDPNVRHTNRPYLSAWQDLTNTSPSYRSPESAPFDQSERTENLYPAEKHVSFPPFNIASTCWPTGQEGYEHSGPPTILPAYFADKLSAPPFSSDSSQLSPVIEQSAVQPSAYASYMSLGNHRNHTPLDRQTDHIFFGNHEPLTPFDMPAFQMSPGLHHPQMNPAMYSADALCRRNYCAPSSTGYLSPNSYQSSPQSQNTSSFSSSAASPQSRNASSLFTAATPRGSSNASCLDQSAAGAPDRLGAYYDNCRASADAAFRQTFGSQRLL